MGVLIINLHWVSRNSFHKSIALKEKQSVNDTEVLRRAVFVRMEWGTTWIN